MSPDACKNAAPGLVRKFDVGINLRNHLTTDENLTQLKSSSGRFVSGLLLHVDLSIKMTGCMDLLQSFGVK